VSAEVEAEAKVCRHVDGPAWTCSYQTLDGLKCWGRPTGCEYVSAGSPLEFKMGRPLFLACELPRFWTWWLGCHFWPGIETEQALGGIVDVVTGFRRALGLECFASRTGVRRAVGTGL
jgi:hypothetical protein